MFGPHAAPGLAFESIGPPRSPSDVLRADIAGFGGVFERGPIFVARRIEDWGAQRATFGGFFRLGGRRHRQAFGPLALYGFQQNGGGTAIVVRLGGRGMRPALATMPDPATGGTIGLVASSPGAWANGVRVSMPLRVRARVAVSAFPVAGNGLAASSIVRVRSSGGVAFGRLIAVPGGVTVTPPTALTGPYVVEVLDPVVDVTITGAGRRERFPDLSLDPDDDRHVWSTLAVAKPLGPEWTPRVPTPWLPLDDPLALALAHQGPGASALVRAVDVQTPYATPGALPRPWPVPTPETDASSSSVAIEATIAGGVDAVRSIDVSAFRSAIELLAEHPLPSVVAIPDLMLAVPPADDPCERKPDMERLPPPAPPPTGCAEPSDPPAGAPRVVDPHAWPPAEPDDDDDVPSLAPESLVAETITTLQLDLATAIATEPAGPAERLALLDPFPGLAPTDVLAEALALSEGAPRPELAALFYPWLRILDPSTEGSSTTVVPPSGHVAGIMARTTRIGGGPSARFANESVAGAVHVARVLDYDERGRVNRGQVCALRAMPGRGVVVFGARTLSFTDDPLRFVPGARVLAFVRRVVRVIGQTLVFEPNDRFLWLKITVTLETALRELFEAGAFAGRTPAESYRIRCDEVTNPDEERERGRVIALVDVALAVPLEFLTIRIAFTRDGARVLDDVPTAGGET